MSLTRERSTNQQAVQGEEASDRTQEPGEQRDANPLAGLAINAATTSDKARHLTDFTRSWRHGRNPLFFALAVITAVFFNSRLTEDSISPIRPHTRYLESVCGGSIDPAQRNLILLVGSSYSRTDCDVRALEEDLASAGYPGLHVVSVSVPTLHIQGTDKMLKRALEVPGIKERLSVVVLDHSLPAQKSFLGQFSGRVPQLWLLGDVSQFLRQVRIILEAQIPRETQVALLKERAYNFAKANFKAGWIGSGLRLFSGTTLHREGKDDPFAVEPIEKTRGYAALRGKEKEWAGTDPNWWKERKAHYVKTKQTVPPIGEAELGILASTLNAILDDPELSDTGIVSVQYPSLWTDVRMEHVQAALGQPAPERVSLVDFSLPETYPEFFRMENLYDKRHLNAETARLLAERMAGAIAELYERNPELYSTPAGLD